jgi:SAM-dependent methyltransferase/uncharacterized protein YbaR (Trm112 family)
MKNWALTYLRCPACKSTFRLDALEETNSAEIISGVLICENEKCHEWYPITHGVPRLLSVSLREELTAEFISQHGAALKASGLVERVDKNHRVDLQDLKQHTIKNFGFEWTEYARHGWDEPVFNIQREQKIFHYKSLLRQDQFEGQLVLDAGCGNGRYTYWAAQYGGKVIGIDLGAGVDAAFDNTGTLPNVQIVQADIFNLPFADSIFDVIFSIGVLMHTGDAQRATKALIQALKPGGSLTVHLYGRGNFIYEWVDHTIRRRTTKLSIPELQHLTRRLWTLTRFLQRVHLLGIVSCFVRLDPHPHCIFDWYSAPIATHHTYSEVKDWFRQTGMPVVQTNEPKRWRSRLLYTIAPPTITVRGEKSI